MIPFVKLKTKSHPTFSSSPSHESTTTRVKWCVLPRSRAFLVSRKGEPRKSPWNITRNSPIFLQNSKIRFLSSLFDIFTVCSSVVLLSRFEICYGAIYPFPLSLYNIICWQSPKTPQQDLSWFWAEICAPAQPDTNTFPPHIMHHISVVSFFLYHIFLAGSRVVVMLPATSPYNRGFFACVSLLFLLPFSLWSTQQKEQDRKEALISIIIPYHMPCALLRAHVNSDDAIQHFELRWEASSFGGKKIFFPFFVFLSLLLCLCHLHSYFFAFSTFSCFF